MIRTIPQYSHDVIPCTFSRLGPLAIWACCLWLAGASCGWSQSVKQGQKPSFRQVTGLVQKELATRDGYESGDLVTRKDVQRVLKAISAAGWTPKDQKQLLEDTLGEDAALAGILGSRSGTSFMRKVKTEQMIYDRMDRVSRVSGGQRMLQDIVKLPDGEKLAKRQRPHGVPGFLDLLPKKTSGKVRSIKDYDEPTGRIYTEEQLLERLQISYQGKTKGKSATK